MCFAYGTVAALCFAHGTVAALRLCRWNRDRFQFYPWDLEILSMEVTVCFLRI